MCFLNIAIIFETRMNNQRIMKSNQEYSNSFFYVLLDKYIYYIVIKKSHKQIINGSTQKNVMVSETQFSHF